MEMWYSEYHTSNVKLDLRIEKQLFSGNSDCQRIDVCESVEFGKFISDDPVRASYMEEHYEHIVEEKAVRELRKFARV